ELFASLQPVAYSGGIVDGTSNSVATSPPAPAAGLAAGYFKRADKGLAGGRRRMEADGKGADRNAFRLKLEEELKANLELGRSVSSAASASKLGDFFQYALDRPVSLPRQKSALLPIVGKDVQAQRVSIYNERTQARFPLLGLRFKNTSGLHLMQGPITVFE